MQFFSRDFFCRETCVKQKVKNDNEDKKIKNDNEEKFDLLLDHSSSKTD